MFEVFAGDPVPGLGRIDAIRKQDGRWVVVTSKGLIVPLTRSRGFRRSGGPERSSTDSHEDYSLTLTVKADVRIVARQPGRFSA
jgi:hypothetical protein